MNGVVEMSYLSTTTGLVLIDSRNQTGTITLPEASTVEGRMIFFKDEFGAFGTSSVTLTTAGANTFEDGGTTFDLNQANGFVSLIASSNTWFRVDGTSNTNRIIRHLEASTLTASSITAYDVTVTGPSTLRVLGSSIFNTVEGRLWSQLSTVQFGTSSSNILFVSGATAFIDAVPFSTSGGSGQQTSNFSTLTMSTLDFWKEELAGFSTYMPTTLVNGVLAIEAYSTLWVAGGDAGGNVSSILTSEDDGLTWTPHVGILPIVRGIAYASSLWVAVGEHPDPTSSIITSVDGSNWTVQPSFSGWSGHCVTYASSMWMAGGSTIGASVLRSFDGFNWTAVSTTLDICRAITYIGSCNMWVTGGEITNAPISGSNLFTSDDGGDTWTERVNTMGPIYSLKSPSWIGIVLCGASTNGTNTIQYTTYDFPGSFSADIRLIQGQTTRAIESYANLAFTIGTNSWVQYYDIAGVYTSNTIFSSINCIKYNEETGQLVAGGYIGPTEGGGFLRSWDGFNWNSNTSNITSSISSYVMTVNVTAAQRLQVEGLPYGVDFTELVSSVEGLGSLGYVSTQTLIESNAYVYNTVLPQKVDVLGDLGVFSSIDSYVSTTEGLQAEFQSNVGVYTEYVNSGYFSAVSTSDLVQTVSTTSTLLGVTLEPLTNPWSSYNVEWTATTSNPTLGDGGITGRFQNIGETVDFTIHLQFGSNTDPGIGNWRFSLPINAFSTYAVLGHTAMYGSTVNGWYQGSAISQYNAGHNSTVAVLWNKGQQSGQFIHSTIPFVWAPEDKLSITGHYRALYPFNYASILEFTRSFFSYIGPTSAPTLASSKLIINGNNVGGYEYKVVPRGNVTLTSNFNMSNWFSPIEDTVSSWVFVNGNLTLEDQTVLTPPVRKLFTVLYVTGDLIINNGASISMSSRGANHAGTGISGGYTAPVDILLANGTFSTFTSGGSLTSNTSTLINPIIAAAGGAGAGGIAAGSGQPGGNGFPWDGCSGGGGSGGTGGSGIPGNGAAGTCFSGGAGGGGANYFSNAGSGGINGGAGGTGAGDTDNGAGNPSGGTGGTLIIICEGMVGGVGQISAQGANAEVYGGASGGGSINIFYNTLGVNLYYGFNGGDMTIGGDGGYGSVRVFQLP